MTMLEALAVIFALIFVGIFCERQKVFSSDQIESLEHFLFKIAIPAQLFTATLDNDIGTFFHAGFFYSYILAFILISLFSLLFFIRESSWPSILMKVFAAGYVNAIIYTLPIVTFLLGDSRSAIFGNFIQVILLQSTFVTMISFVKHKEKSLTHRILAAVGTPVVIMPIIGLILNAANIIPHNIIKETIYNLGKGTSGIALFVFGLSLSSVRFNKEIFNKDLMAIIFTKNILHPICALLIGRYLFGLESYWLTSLVISASAPTAFIAYIISKQFQISPELVKRVVAVSSALSLISLILITLLI